jgi:iron complex outermembrane recepter protein
MKNIFLTTLTLILFVSNAYVQETTFDTSAARTLGEVIVKGYEQDRPLQEVGAAVSIIDQKQLQRTSGISILPALNATPGIRMEERSPGSYRLNIRGSSLRSPFGVRNVKIYLGEIPFTDPGGTSYLNQFSLFNFSSIEILKGPGSSLFGAGTGGVMLINPLADSLLNGLSVHYTRGSFDTRLLHLAAVTGNENYKHTLSYTRQSSDGYRMQSAMKREVFSWQSRMRAGEKQRLSTHVFYGDLYYQTPGALTLAQYRANPKAARPAAGMFPSAQDASAAIYQKTFWAGINHQYQFTENLQHAASVYGAISHVRNPTIRNYERRSEPHFGGRTTLSYSGSRGNTSLKLIGGAEFQQGDFNIRVFGNNKGNPDTLQTDDDVHNRQIAVFAQAEIAFQHGWILTAGGSLNNTRLQFTRLSVVPNFQYNSSFNNELAPRLSLLKAISPRLSVYGIVSKGYSPPTVAEVLPSTTVINTSLEAEKGINYEVGARGNFFGSRLYFDINAFYFTLDQAITQRRDAGGADFFINAGGTKQKGLETYISYQLASNPYRLISGWSVYGSHTYHHFRYRNYKPLNNDYSGKKLPGVAPHTVTAGVDVETNVGLFINVNYFFSDRIAMNDANAEFAPDYHLLGGKLGFRKKLGKHIQSEVFVAADNLFNESYSLGNDINALGNRFYNAAAGVNYQAGIVMRYTK